MNLLIVCTQNTCRSPMLESMLVNYLSTKGVDDIVIKSAGIYGGNLLISKECEKTLDLHNIQAHSTVSTRLTQQLVNWSNLILTMTDNQQEYISATFQSANVQSLSCIANGDINDPYGKGAKAYEDLYITFDKLLENIVDLLKTYR